MAYRDSTTNSNASSTTASVAVPTGSAVNDITILACTVDRTDQTFSGLWPANFNHLGQVTLSANDGQCIGVAYKRLTGADSGTYTLSTFGFTTNWVCQAIAFSGRHTTDAPVAQSTTHDTNDSSPVSVALTGVTASSGDDILAISGPDVNATGIGNGHTAPSTYIEAEDDEIAFSNLSLAYKENVSAGATGTLTFTFSLTSGAAAWGGFVIRIPAVAGGGGRTALNTRAFPLGINVGMGWRMPI